MMPAVTSAATLLEKACRPLDWLRLRWLRAILPAAKPFLRRRDWRVAVFGGSVILTSMAATLLCPFWLLALGPICWGTPHLLSDLRYLVFKPGYLRRRLFWLLVAVPILVAGLGWHSMRVGLLAVLGAAVLGHGKFGRKATAALIGLALLLVVWPHEELSQLVFAHLHNFIAVLLWWYWRPGRKLFSAAIPLAFLACSAAIFFGAATPLPGLLNWAPSGLTAGEHLATMAPGLAAPWGLRLVLLFAFAQAVHYGIWLRLIPEEDRPQATPRTFAASIRALRVDMGSGILWVAVLLGLGFAIWAVADLAQSRIGYLRLALFHGYLELAAATLLFIERPGRTETP